jgi:SnoaL-like protein
METIGRAFIDAFNHRDAEALVALCDPTIDFHPTPLVGSHRAYRGHDGVREWVTDLRSSTIDHRVRVRKVLELDGRRFLVLAKVLLDGEVVSPAAMLARVGDDGLIVEAHAYLSDEEILAQMGLTDAEVDVAERPGLVVERDVAR